MNQRSRQRAMVAGWLALMPACLSIPPFTGVGFEPDGTGGTIVGKDFALHFGTGAFAFPDRLEIGGKNVLASRTTCSGEDAVGIAITPGFIASASSTSTGTSTLTTILNGPAAVQVAVAWSGTFQCQQSDTVSGTSTFTAFPDGRIVRHDVLDLTVPSGPDTPACQASCASESKFVVTSFFTFSTAAFTSVESEVSSDLPAAPAPGHPTGKGVCLNGQGQKLAFRYDESAGLLPARLLAPDANTFALDYDLIASTGSLASTSAVPYTMAFRPDTHDTDCMELGRPFDPAGIYFDDVGATPRSGDMQPFSDANGIYHALRPANDGAVVLSADADVPGIAVILMFPGANDIASEARNFHQNNGDGTFTIWFQDPITNSVTVTSQ